MKAGGFFTAVGLLAILGGLVWWTNKHPSTTEAKSGASATTKIVSIEPKDIEGLRIVKPGAEPIELNKVADSWEIAKPTAMHADPDAVGMMTSLLAALNADRLIDDHPASLNEFGLNAPTEELDITLKGGKTQKLLIGGDTPADTGVYAKLDSSPKVYTIPAYMKASFDKSVNDLRDKRLLTFNQDKLTSVTMTGKGPAIEFGKNAQGDWQITKPKPMRADSLVVDDFVHKAKDAKMDLTGADAESKAATQFAQGEKVGTVSTTDNTGTQTLEIHKGKDNSYYAKSSAIAGIYKVSGDIGDSFSKTADDYRNKKLFDFGFTDPTKVEINGMAYQKSGDKWMSGSAQYDAGSVQGLVDKLRDLSATSFSDKMAGTQAFAVAVTSGDKNKTEKITIDKNGDVYDAQREGEPDVYVLDSKSVDDLQKAAAAIKPAHAAKPEKKKT